jgi:hypothetical protein
MMTIALTIPFWVIIATLISVGLVGFYIIASFAGDYDFFTPFIALGWGLVFIILAVGLVIGKYVF